MSSIHKRKERDRQNRGGGDFQEEKKESQKAERGKEKREHLLIPSTTLRTLSLQGQFAHIQLRQATLTERITTPLAHTTLNQRLEHILQLRDFLPQRTDLKNRSVEFDIGLASLHLLIPTISLKVAAMEHLLPFHRHVFIVFTTTPVLLDKPSFLLLEHGGDEEERGVNDSHDHIVETVVAFLVHPPFKGEDEKDHFDEVERGDEDVFVGGTHELHGFLGEESHVFVDGGRGDVFVGRVV